MEKKISQKLFDGTAKQYDQKHILNVSEKVISNSIIAEIEKNGISSEMLDRLNLPVFRYRTQVTIHGIFPVGAAIRVGGYSNLVKNNNGSLGVRYTAIDRKKKQELYSLVRHYTPDYWCFEDNSTAYALYHQEVVTTPAQYEELKEKATRINEALKACAFAQVSAYIALSMFGRVYGVIYLHITSFYEKDMERVFRAISPDVKGDFLTLRSAYANYVEDERKKNEARLAAHRKEFEAQEKKRKAELAENEKQATAMLAAFAAKNGYTLANHVDLCRKSFYVLRLRKDRNDTFKVEHLRYDGKQAVAKITYFDKDGNKIHPTDSRPRQTKRMTLHNVYIKAV